MTLSLTHRCLLLIGAASLVAVADIARSDQMARDLPPPTAIRDLDYGDVLFHYFADDDFEALVRLEAYQDFGLIPHHEAEAELLTGGIDLSLGLYTEATRIFNRLLAGPVPQSVKDRALFYLARIGYRRGYPDEAWGYLSRIRGPLPGELEPERRLLASNVLMAQGRLNEAVSQLQGWTDTSDWAAYARFNLGVALIRSGDVARGRPLLEAVGQMRANSEEQLSLRDRANLALGYASLQQHQPDGAVTALSRVRVDGPFTNAALLGLGWAQTDAKRPQQALAPWLKLRGRPLIDLPVQESYLAVPYAYAQLAANGEAAQQYQIAMQAYANESRRIDESIAAIRQGGFLDSILKAVPRTTDIGSFWQLRKLQDTPQTRYLYHLLASHEFQEGLKNYRDLRIMQENLERWRGSLAAFDAMIAARKQAAIERGPRQQQVLAGIDVGALERRQAQLEARAAAIESNREVGALASGDEARQWQALRKAEATAQALPPGPQRDELLERTRQLRGTLTWKFDTDYQTRLRTLHEDLRDSAAALKTTKRLAAVLGQVGELEPGNAAKFATRVQELAARIEAIEPRIDSVAAAQERASANLAVTVLEAQKQRLATYAAQAQFALASLYDGKSATVPK